MVKKKVIEEIFWLRDKYVYHRRKTERETGKKSPVIRAKVSVLDELLNGLGENDRGHVKGVHVAKNKDIK